MLYPACLSPESLAMNKFYLAGLLARSLFSTFPSACGGQWHGDWTVQFAICSLQFTVLSFKVYNET